MNIKLKGNYIITSNSLGYVLSKWKMVKDKKGKEVINLSNSTYHNTLEAILKSYKERCIKESDFTTLDEVLVKINELDKYIKEVLGGI